MKLYRVMKVDPADGRPLVGCRRNMLGVRPTDPTNTNPNRRFDVTAVVGSDLVSPGEGNGLSVSLAVGGFTVAPNEAIWEIDDGNLAPEFAAIPDSPIHCVLEPQRLMTLDEYQAAIAATRDLWTRVP